ncbi:MAG: hypothetical protein MK004_21020, partial [Planctomycetales bacterium]|nr:hypothetical protein [Planctomycetales bacterium]
VVCDWIGNTEAIASKHYLQVTEDHFSKAVRNPVQQPAVLPRTGPQSDLALSTQAPVLQRDAANCQKVPKGQTQQYGWTEPVQDIRHDHRSLCL